MQLREGQQYRHNSTGKVIEIGPPAHLPGVDLVFDPANVKITSALAQHFDALYPGEINQNYTLVRDVPNDYKDADVRYNERLAARPWYVKFSNAMAYLFSFKWYL